MAVKREAFVLWLERDSVAPDRLRGSVEHTRSSLRSRFESTEELVELLGRALSLPPRNPYEPSGEAR